VKVMSIVPFANSNCDGNLPCRTFLQVVASTLAKVTDPALFPVNERSNSSDYQLRIIVFLIYANLERWKIMYDKLTESSGSFDRDILSASLQL